MHSQAIQNGAHTVLAHTEVKIAAGTIVRAELAGTAQERIIRGRQIGRAADERGDRRGNGVEHTP
jgi:hypothetical protein